MVAFSAPRPSDGCCNAGDYGGDGCCCSAEDGFCIAAEACCNGVDCGGGCRCNAADGRNYVLSVRAAEGYSVSKVFAASIGAPRQLTVAILYGADADIVAVPELFSSAYIPWRWGGACRLGETARALAHAGLCGQAASCVAAALAVIYSAVDRDGVGFGEAARNCVFTSSGLVELGDECKDRLFGDGRALPGCPSGSGGLPF